MSYFIFFIIVILVTYLSNIKSFMPNYNGNNHQKFLNEKNVPLIGGFFLLLSFFQTYFDKDLPLAIFFSLIFFTGLFSDSRFLSSPKLRLFLQLIIISIFVFYFDIHVTPTRINFIDEFLKDNFLGLIFTIFCFLVLVNGSNFVDGLNGLLLGYFLIIFFNLNNGNFLLTLGYTYSDINFLIFSFIIILLLNFFNYLFLGDGGSYLLALFFGFLLTLLYNTTNELSPYYIILMLWYPCFETLFSLIRKYLNNKSPMKPDNLHLHHLIFSYYQKKFNIKNTLIVNTLSSISINFFNLIILSLASTNPNLTVFQLKLIFFAIITYCLIYFMLKQSLRFNFKK